MKELLKSDSICESYARIKKESSFLWLAVYVTKVTYDIHEHICTTCFQKKCTKMQLQQFIVIPNIIFKRQQTTMLMLTRTLLHENKPGKRVLLLGTLSRADGRLWLEDEASSACIYVIIIITENWTCPFENNLLHFNVVSLLSSYYYYCEQT